MLLVLSSLFLWNHFHLRCNYLCVGPNKILIQTPFYAIFQSPLNSLKSGICNVYAFKLKGMHSTTIFRNYSMYYDSMDVCFSIYITGHIFTSVSARFAIYIPLFLPISFPVLASLWQAYKWWRGQDKPKQEWQHNSIYGFFLLHELFCLTSCVMDIVCYGPDFKTLF